MSAWALVYHNGVSTKSRKWHVMSGYKKNAINDRIMSRYDIIMYI